MLMAAGLGTRLRPFTDVLPKPLLPLMGVPMAQFAVDHLQAAGVKKIVANIHHLPDVAKKGLKALDLGAAKLTLSDESRLLLGSAGGIAKAASKLGRNPFFFFNADVVCNVDLEKLAQRHFELKEKFGVRMTLAVLPPRNSPGEYREMILDKNRGLITGTGSIRSGVHFFSGVAVMERDVIKKVSKAEPSDFFATILSPALYDNEVGFFLSDALWYDIGSPALWHRTHLDWLEMLEKNTFPKAWRERVEKTSVRLGAQAWSGKQSPAATHSEAPFYYEGSQSLQRLGPAAIAYDWGQNLSNGIALRDKVVKF